LNEKFIRMVNYKNLSCVERTDPKRKNKTDVIAWFDKIYFDSENRISIHKVTNKKLDNFNHIECFEFLDGLLFNTWKLLIRNNNVCYEAVYSEFEISKPFKKYHSGPFKIEQVYKTKVPSFYSQFEIAKCQRISKDILVKLMLLRFMFKFFN